ncbi:MAG: hypothetical protein ACM34I_10855 [bacterium]
MDGKHAADFADVNHNHDAVYQKKYPKVAVVAQSGGDYTSPITAMANVPVWCGTPSSSNYCLLKIMPGVYNIGSVSLQMQSYIDIEGSGMGVTKIFGTISGLYAGTIRGASNSEIRSLTVENSGANQNLAFYNEQASVTMSNMSLIASGGTINCSIHNWRSSPIIQNVFAQVSGQDSSNIAIVNTSLSNPKMSDVTILVEGNACDNAGLQNGDMSVADVKNLNIELNGEGRGIFDLSGAQSKISGLTINISGANCGYNVGIQIVDSSPKIKNFDIHVQNGAGVLVDGNSAPEFYDGKIVNSLGSGIVAWGNSVLNMVNLDMAGAQAGLENRVSGNGKIILHRSIIKGGLNSFNSGRVEIALSQVDGQISGPGIFACFQVYDNNFLAITCP